MKSLLLNRRILFGIDIESPVAPVDESALVLGDVVAGFFSQRISRCIEVCKTHEIALMPCSILSAIYGSRKGVLAQVVCQLPCECSFVVILLMVDNDE